MVAELGSYLRTYKPPLSDYSCPKLQVATNYHSREMVSASLETDWRDTRLSKLTYTAVHSKQDMQVCYGGTGKSYPFLVHASPQMFNNK